MNEDEKDASRRYWKAAIAALPAEKRDAAWEFYLDKFAGTTAGDTFSGLILLLEANGAFLLTLPQKFHSELTQPVTDQLLALRKELQDNVESQRAALLASDDATDELQKANTRLADASNELAGKIHAAAKQIDTAALASQVFQQLESSIVSPVRLALRTLPDESERIDAASKAAEGSIEKWRRLHFGGIVANTCAAAFIVISGIFLFAEHRVEHHFEQRLASEIVEISGSHETLKELALMNISVHLTAWCDPAGNVVPDGYALVIDHAQDAQVQTADDGKHGLVFFKAQRREHESDNLRALVHELPAAVDQ